MLETSLKLLCFPVFTNFVFDKL